MKSRVTCAALLAACAAVPAAAQTTLTLSSWVPPTHALTLAQNEWCDLVAKNANGKIKCNLLPRAVAAPPGTFDAIKNGVADVSFIVHGYTPGRFVFTKVAEFPFLGDASEPISIAYDKVASRHPEFRQEHQGVHVIAFFTHGPAMTMNVKHPVKDLADMQGLKWRIGGGLVNDLSKAWGVNATLKPATENYELISSGVMDGTLLPAESMESFKIDKLIKYVTTFPGGLYNTSFALIMNQAKYDKLSPDEKKAVDAASGEVAARIIGRQWDKADRRAHALMQANNIQVTKADPKFVAEIKARTVPVEQAWAKEARAKGLKDPEKLLAEFRSEIAKQEK
ncbi:MAG TPA: TRAP transporter substrate-binding protein [Ramlibacter sp.]